MEQAYSGIDWLFSGEAHRLEYSFELHPGADPKQIRMLFPNGKLSILPNGDLEIRYGARKVIHSAPEAFQIVDGKRVLVPVKFLERSRSIGFELGSYDHAKALIIDPVLSYYLFEGGVQQDTATAAIADPEGFLYYAGWSNSLDLLISGTPYRDFNSGKRDAFLAKLGANGNFIYTTYIGGAENDEPSGISFDSFHNAYLAGTTFSANFPTFSTSLQQSYGGNGDAFVLKMNAEGSSLTYSSYLGGSSLDSGQGVASDSQGFATFIGFTSSSNLPLVNARQTSFGGVEDLFLFKLHSNSSEVVYSTYFGSDRGEEGTAIALDSLGNAYITGRADCGSLSPGASLGPLSGTDVLVMKWKADGTGAAYVTCVGGNGTEAGYGIAVDGIGDTYVTGYTSSTNFPVFQPLQPAYGGQDGTLGDAFVFKLNAAGNQFVYSTYLGGSKDDWGQSIAVNTLGEAFVAGTTSSPNFPATFSAQPGPSTRAGFLARLSAQGGTLLNTWFFDGITGDDRYSVTLDTRGEIYVAGGATSQFRLPSSRRGPLNPFKGTANSDAFIAKLTSSQIQVIQDTYTHVLPNTNDFVLTQRVINRGTEDADNISFRGSIPSGLTLVNCVSAKATCFNSGTAYRVDVGQLPVGKAIEVTLTMRFVSVGQGIAFSIVNNVTTDTYDSYLADNSSTATLFLGQPGTSCNFALSALTQTIQAAGGAVTLSISAPLSCPWAAMTQSDWISFTSPNLATGSSNLTLNVAPNPLTISRIGSLMVAGQRVLFLQKPAGIQTAAFSDVPVTHPFFDYIQMMRFYGITTGCTATEYCPDAPTTRGQMAVFIIRSMLGTDDFSFPAAPYFTDVPGSHPQFRYIQKMRELGITAGCMANTYCPSNNVTRSQMAVFLVRARFGIASEQTFPFPDALSFTDVPQSFQTYPYVQKMKENTITSGCTTTTYCPDDNTTRGQMAVFLMRAFLAP